VSGEAVARGRPGYPETAAYPAEFQETTPAEPRTSYGSAEDTSRLTGVSVHADPSDRTSDATRSHDAAAASRGPVIKALDWVWRQIVISLAAYAEATYPGLVVRGDCVHHQRTETDSSAVHQTHEPYQTDATQTFPHSPGSPGPAAPLDLSGTRLSHRPAKKRLLVAGLWSKWRGSRATKATIAKPEVHDDYH
jgi:hypothetical protein